MTPMEAVLENPIVAPSQSLDREQRKVVASSVIGTTVEYYDFLIYGTASALLFNRLFFPSFDPIVGTIAAFAAHSVGFLARPIGAAIFGHFGDRVGRKAMLSLTLVIMGLGTFLLGCLPTYDQVGVWAPIALVTLRLLQGIGLGGEWGGAVLMVVESVPSRRRGFFASTVQLGYPIGVVASTGAFALVSLLPEAELYAWGWRLPFLASIFFVGIGLFIRLRVHESPAFERLKRQHAVAKLPLVEILTRHPGTFLRAVGLKVSEVGFVNILCKGRTNSRPLWRSKTRPMAAAA
ncbi:MHS family MFS transporter [Methylobacterium sp. WL30]|nr:MHS family MFS transporter [Methylobacterium sp. WL93]TXN45354.1 MHS family MFS transporter [Methylobacterium sp. WL119]TXN63518.1 MHS family MFS transporter [Methylobacterium sp. WL30]